MSLLGTQLTLLIGPTVPLPAPVSFLEALESVEVTHNDTERSGFQLVFRAGRGTSDLLDYGLMTSPLLRPCSRVVMIVTFCGIPALLMDGIITRQELKPGNDPGTGMFALTGEDVSVMMDQDEVSVEHPGQMDTVIVLKIIASYPQFGLIPQVIPPPTVDIPLPTERIPVQQCTDQEYVRHLAKCHGYVFYVTPGPAPLTNTAYWGPPVRIGVPQRALSVNMGPNSNVSDLNFQFDALSPTFVSGQLRDRQTSQTLPLQTFASTRLPLSSQPAWATQAKVRTQQFRQSGLNAAQAFGKIQAETDNSNDQVITATGVLDASRYEALLKPRGVVGLRGTGFSYDGLYYVKQVKHQISIGQYTQNFTLTRDGLGAISPVVVP